MLGQRRRSGLSGKRSRRTQGPLYPGPNSRHQVVAAARRCCRLTAPRRLQRQQAIGRKEQANEAQTKGSAELSDKAETSKTWLATL